MACASQPRLIPAQRILGGLSPSPSFGPSQIHGSSTMFLIRTSCSETTEASGYHCAWTRWVVSVNGSLTIVNKNFSKKAMLHFSVRFCFLFLFSFKSQFLFLGLQGYLIRKVKDFHEFIIKSYL